jgi:hypothetical protein
MCAQFAHVIFSAMDEARLAAPQVGKSQRSLREEFAISPRFRTTCSIERSDSAWLIARPE